MESKIQQVATDSTSLVGLFFFPLFPHWFLLTSFPLKNSNFIADSFIQAFTMNDPEINDELEANPADDDEPDPDPE
jgi:hypothetical protein